MTRSDHSIRWDWAPLGEVCEVIMGQSPPSSTYRDEAEGLPFFQGKADFGLVHPTARKWCIEPKKIARPGDVLLSVRAPVGPTNVADVECCIGRGLAAIRGGPDVEQEFLRYALQFVEPEIVRQGTGRTFQAIGGKRLKTITIPVPPIDEQRRLIERLRNRLDVIRRAEEAARAQIVALEAMPAALLREFFSRSLSAILNRGKRSVRLGEVCEIVNGSTPKSQIESYWGGEIRWITPADLGQLSTPEIDTSERTITQSGYESCSTKMVPPGSVIMSSRAPIGHLGIARISLCTNQGCKSFVPNGEIDSSYLYWMLRAVVNDIRALGSGATFPEVSKATLAEFEIPLPDLPMQEICALQMRASQQAIDQTLKITTDRIADLRMMNQAIVHHGLMQ